MSRLQSQSRRKDDALGLSLDRLDRAVAADVPGQEREWAQVLALSEEVQHAAEAFQPATDPYPTTRAGGVADFGTIRQQAEQLLAALQENKKAEMKLVLESINTDIGVGD